MLKFKLTNYFRNLKYKCLYYRLKHKERIEDALLIIIFSIIVLFVMLVTQGN